LLSWGHGWGHGLNQSVRAAVALAAVVAPVAGERRVGDAARFGAGADPEVTI